MKTKPTTKTGGWITLTILLGVLAHPAFAQAATYSITPAAATVDENVGTLTFTISRSGGTPATTIYASTLNGVANGYAVNIGDYAGVANQPVSFSAGQVSAMVNVTILR